MTSIPGWPRPHYTGPGGKPSLFFAVYGSFGDRPPMNAIQYRTQGVPEGINLTSLSGDERPEESPGFRECWLWQSLEERDPKLAEQVLEAPECLMLMGEIEDSPTLDYLRDAVGLITYLADHGGICIYDPWQFAWWTPKDWRKKIFSPAAPAPRQHVVVLTSPEKGNRRTWFHTRGMRKFGRPDLSIHQVPKKLHPAVIDLCERFIEFQALGGLIEEGQVIRMKSLPAGVVCQHGGSLDDPDFNNVHVEIGPIA